jgi:hypothetical protein
MDEKRRPLRPLRGSLFIPLALITLGILLFLQNTGMLTDDLGQNIIRLWPILLIIIGLDGVFRQEGLVGPIFLVGLGVVFLLSNLGYLAFEAWPFVLRLWPVLLIAFGLDILTRRRSIAWGLLGLLVALAVLAAALWLAGVRLWFS